MSTHTNTLPPCTASASSDGLRGRLGVLFGAFHQAVRRWTAFRERRRAFLNLAALDDRALEDIGLLRGEVETAAKLPLEINASLAVRQMAADRRAAEQRMRRR